MKRNKNIMQQGFTVVEVLLVLIFLALVVFIGYYVHHSQQGKPVSAKTPAATTPRTTKAADSKSVAQGTNQKQLVITEWGVEIPYTSTDTLTYRMDTPGSQSVEVASANLARIYGGDCASFGSGIISRSAGTDPYYPDQGGDSSGTVAQAYVNGQGYQGHPFVKVGNYYYNFSHDQGACADAESADAGNAANAFLLSILPSMHAIQ